jgi:hypothetical protein
MLTMRIIPKMRVRPAEQKEQGAVGDAVEELRDPELHLERTHGPGFYYVRARPGHPPGRRFCGRGALASAVAAPDRPGPR